MCTILHITRTHAQIRFIPFFRHSFSRASLLLSLALLHRMDHYAFVVTIKSCIKLSISPIFYHLREKCTYILEYNMRCFYIVLLVPCISCKCDTHLHSIIFNIQYSVHAKKMYIFLMNMKMRLCMNRIIFFPFCQYICKNGICFSFCNSKSILLWCDEKRKFILFCWMNWMRL